jgi:hypothetical protein
MPVEQKLAKAAIYGAEELGEQVLVQVRALLTPESLETMAAFTALYVASQWTPAGWAADLMVGTVVVGGLFMAGREAVEIMKHVVGYGQAIQATSDADLRVAGHHFAVALSKAGVDIVSAILLHKVSKSVTPEGPVGKLVAGLVEPKVSVQMITPDGAVVDVPVETIMPRGGRGGRPPGAVLKALFGEILHEATLPDGATVIRSRVGRPPGRLGLEDTLPPGVEVNLDGWARCHSQGNITGAESARGIRYAPNEVNQQYQRLGIERAVRELFEAKAPDTEVVLTTETRSHPGTLRLAEIVYRVDLKRASGATIRAYEASIEVANQTTAPAVTPSAEPIGWDLLGVDGWLRAAAGKGGSGR